jgi:hypothetical protein
VWRPDRLHPAAPRAVNAVTDAPEFSVVIFALLLNFAWEILQAPLYAGMADRPHAQVIRACLQATVGDAVIMLMAHGAVAAVARSRRWIVAPRGSQLALFVAIGVSITAAIEGLATRGYWIGQWNYLPTMPLVPGTGIGLVPLLQWVVLPLLTVWFVRRQLARRSEAIPHERPASRLRS